MNRQSSKKGYGHAYVAAMVLDSFHPFLSLPFELRRMIYLHASPPRFVHVREHTEDKDAFEERFRTTVAQIKLHPSIAYFARHWRERIPFPPVWWRWYDGRYQTTLERYGLGSSRRQNHQPWEPTTNIPDIPYSFLSENPDVAWEFMRTGSFYSKAPIPVMLHVTRESRQVLIDFGYELAFRTRSCGPRTWFNFKIDVLYIGYSDDADERPFHNLLSGSKQWDIGQFEPRELRRIRRVALEPSAYMMPFNNEESIREISNILELLGSVEELFLEEIIMRWKSPSLSIYVQPEDDRPLWFYQPVQEVDVLSDIVEDCGILRSTGYYHEKFRAYKDANMGNGRDYFIDEAREIEQALLLRRDRLVRDGLLTPWKIPKANVVYILPERLCRALNGWRWDLWYRHQAIKEEEARCKAQEEAQRSIDVPRRPIIGDGGDQNLPPSPFSQAFQDDLEVLEELMTFPYDDYIASTTYRASEWAWLVAATISPPEI